MQTVNHVVTWKKTAFINPITPFKNWFRHIKQNIRTSNCFIFCALLKNTWFMEGLLRVRPSQPNWQKRLALLVQPSKAFHKEYFLPTGCILLSYGQKLWKHWRYSLLLVYLWISFWLVCHNYSWLNQWCVKGNNACLHTKLWM